MKRAQWHDTFELQQQLARWWGTETGISYGTGFAEELLKSDKAPAWATPRQEHWPRQLPSIEREKIGVASPYWVSDEMAQVALAASETMPPEPLHESDLLTPSGFVVHEKPLLFADHRGDPMPLRLWSWRIYTFGGRSLCACSYYGPCVDPRVKDLPPWRQPPPDNCTLFHLTPWPFDLPYGGVLDQHSMHVLKFCKAFWTLLKQDITVRERRGIPRSIRRRMPTDRLYDEPEPADNVTVITLRRAYRGGVDPTPTTVDWKCRWLVRAHWRNQYLPSTGTHRLQYIFEHIKGPEDKPLQIKRSIRKVVR